MIVLDRRRLVCPLIVAIRASLVHIAVVGPIHRCFLCAPLGKVPKTAEYPDSTISTACCHQPNQPHQTPARRETARQADNESQFIVEYFM